MKKLMVASLALAAALGSINPAVSQDKQLRYATAGDIYGLDPHSMIEAFTLNFLQHIYEPLVRYNKDLTIEPALAVSWEIIEPTVVRYHLRENVKFHNGEDFTADDVVASLSRAIHPKSPVKVFLPGLIEVKKIDDYTVDLITDKPTPLLNNNLSIIGIMDAGWLKEHNALDPVDAQTGQDGHTIRNANGTGPFSVESRRADAQTVLAANKDWWDKPVHNLSGVVHTPISSDSTRVAALLSGEVDVIVPSPLQDAGRLSSAPGVKLLESAGVRSIMMGFNMKDKLNNGDIDGNPFQNPAVRKAVYQAINMDLIRDRIMRGKSENTGALVASSYPGFDVGLAQRFEYDVEAAKKALADAGYPNGFQFNMNCPNDAYVNDEEICQAIAAMLSQAGLRPKLNAETRTIHFQKMLAGQTDFHMLGWASLPQMDGFMVLSNLLHTQKDNYGAWNPGGYSNARLDELTEAVTSELDETKRRAMMVEAFGLAKQDISWIPLHQQPISWAVRDNVEVVQTPDDLLRLRYVKIN